MGALLHPAAGNDPELVLEHCKAVHDTLTRAVDATAKAADSHSQGG